MNSFVLFEYYFGFFTDIYGFSWIHSNSFGFFRILSSSLGIWSDSLVFFRIPLDSLRTSRNLIGFSDIFSYSFRIFPYSLEFFLIIPDASEFSRNFVGFSRILRGSLMFSHILSDSFRTLFDSLGFGIFSDPLWLLSYSLRIISDYLQLFLDSLGFTRILSDFFEFSQILPKLLRFFRFFTSFRFFGFLGFPSFLAFSLITSDSVIFCCIRPGSLELFLDLPGFTRILSIFSDSFELFLVLWVP